MEPWIASTYSLLVPIKQIPSKCSSYNHLTLSDNDTSLFILIDISNSPANIILDLFPFKLIIDHWWKVVVSYQSWYVLQDEVSGYTIVIYFHSTIVNNETQVVFAIYFYGELFI